jgi:ubiquinone biosynthesis protein COQ9
MDLQEIRDRVLLATLPHVAFEGWSESALRAGIAECGLPEADASLAFTEGPPEMIAHWSAWADRQMLQALQHQAEAGAETAAEANGGTGGRIAAAVRARIEVNAPWREAVRRTLSFLALPGSVPLAARSTYATVDAVWYACGDASTDFSFYSKRATLAAIYGATVLYWLEDQSEGSAETWGFLDRRLADAMRFPRLRRRTGDWLAGLALPGFRFPWRQPAVGTGLQPRDPAHDPGGA